MEHADTCFCIECRFCEPGLQADLRCKWHLDLIEKTPLNCRFCRMDEDLCGEAGDNWESKEEWEEDQNETDDDNSD